MTIREIVTGNDDFKGLIPLINEFLGRSNILPETRQVVNKYLEVILMRACLEIPTVASWMRSFVETHPLYKHDSRVGDEIAYDLLMKMNAVSQLGRD